MHDLYKIPPEELAFKSLPAYIAFQQPTYRFAPHNLMISNVLERVESGEIRRLIVALPPRHGKTMQIGEFFPAWYIGRNPTHQIIYATYAFERAGDVGRKIRNQMLDIPYQKIFPESKLSLDNRGINRFSTTQGGNVFAVGVGGVITGRGANCLIIDDAHKGRREVESDAQRNQVIDWYQSVAYTRLMPDNRVVIVQCLTGDAPVLMSDGSWKRLDQIRAGHFVLSYDNGKHISKKVLNWTCQGEDDIYEVKLGGHSIKANLRHPFLVFKDNKFEWVRLKDLEKKDQVVISKKIHFESKQKLSIKQAWLLGFMFGDGWVTINEKTNTNKNGYQYRTESIITCFAYGNKPILANKVKDRFSQIFGEMTWRDSKVGYFRNEKADVGRWLLSCGIHGGAKGKRIPKFMFSEPIPIRMAFLNGFRSADGHIYLYKNHSKNTLKRCVIGLANYELIQDLRHLARSCGFSPENVSIKKAMAKAPHSHVAIESMVARTAYPLGKIKKSEFSLKPVRSITYCGKEKVYDIQVEGSENFIADGMVTHNTRWHFSDLVGFVIEEMKHEKWHLLKLPAICDSNNDLLGREIGTALWETDYPLETLENIRETVGTREWNAQYQQNPLPASGGIVELDWFSRYDWGSWAAVEFILKSTDNPIQKINIPYELYRIVISIDTAFKESDLNDPSAFTIWGVTRQNKIYLLNTINKRMKYPLLKKTTLETWVKYSRVLTGSPVTVLIEDKASGQSLIQELMSTQIPVKAMPADSSKQIRMSSASPQIESGRVHLPTKAPWLVGYETQIARFPAWDEDDLVDSTSQFLNWFSQPKFVKRDIRFWK